MTKPKRAPALKSIDAVVWSAVRLQRVAYKPAGKIFAQGEPATMYVEKGAVRLSVLSHAGKEAVVALLKASHFFGEGCLGGPDAEAQFRLANGYRVVRTS